ncbi:MAG: diguanylate cyclase domain-containing protein [Armatimonadota bacterium]
MTTDVICLEPCDTVKTAVMLMKGHGIGSLPVLDGNSVLGMVGYQDILGKNDDIQVRALADTYFLSINPYTSVSETGSLMNRYGTSRALVIDKGRLCGIVTSRNLLSVSDQQIDPLTGLLCKDAVRTWSDSVLKNGQDMSVLFIDMEGFDQFNKKYGYDTGDKALQHTASALKSVVDNDKDCLCRYDGDEFVIATTRVADESGALADRITQVLENNSHPELPEMPKAAVGIYNCNCVNADNHPSDETYLDYLVDLAHKACSESRQKNISLSHSVEQLLNNSPDTSKEMQADEISEIAGDRRLRIEGINLSWDGSSMATCEIELSNGFDKRKQSKTGSGAANNVLRLVAEAAADAVTEFLPPDGYAIIAESVSCIHGNFQEDIILVTAMLITPQNQHKLSGSAPVEHGSYRATAAALLNAVNRKISKLI